MSGREVEGGGAVEEVVGREKDEDGLRSLKLERVTVVGVWEFTEANRMQRNSSTALTLNSK